MHTLYALLNQGLKSSLIQHDATSQGTHSHILEYSASLGVLATSIAHVEGWHWHSMVFLALHETGQARCNSEQHTSKHIMSPKCQHDLI